MEGIKLVRRGRATAALPGYLSLARVRQAQRDVAGREGIHDVWPLATRSEATEIDDLNVAMLRARPAIARGDLDVARSWLEERGR